MVLPAKVGNQQLHRTSQPYSHTIVHLVLNLMTHDKTFYDLVTQFCNPSQIHQDPPEDNFMRCHVIPFYNPLSY